jgi:hypothetical protein
VSRRYQRDLSTHGELWALPFCSVAPGQDAVVQLDLPKRCALGRLAFHHLQGLDGVEIISISIGETRLLDRPGPAVLFAFDQGSSIPWHHVADAGESITIELKNHGIEPYRFSATLETDAWDSSPIEAQLLELIADIAGPSCRAPQQGKTAHLTIALERQDLARARSAMTYAIGGTDALTTVAIVIDAFLRVGVEPADILARLTWHHADGSHAWELPFGRLIG